jgi:hypothetical protein
MGCCRLHSSSVTDLVLYSGVPSMGVPGGAMAPPGFGKLVNSISTRVDKLCPSNNTGTPGFSDLPTAALCYTCNFLSGLTMDIKC